MGQGEVVVKRWWWWWCGGVLFLKPVRNHSPPPSWCTSLSHPQTPPLAPGPLRSTRPTRHSASPRWRGPSWASSSTPHGQCSRWPPGVLVCGGGGKRGEVVLPSVSSPSPATQSTQHRVLRPQHDQGQCGWSGAGVEVEGKDWGGATAPGAIIQSPPPPLVENSRLCVQQWRRAPPLGRHPLPRRRRARRPPRAYVSDSDLAPQDRSQDQIQC